MPNKKFHITESKKAKTTIESFTKRENTTYKYLLELCGNTIEKQVMCTYEQQFKTETDSRQKYVQACKEAHNEQFRLEYIFQCLDLDVRIDYKEEIIQIKLTNE